MNSRRASSDFPAASSDCPFRYRNCASSPLNGGLSFRFTGTVDTIKNLEADKFYSLVEGKGIVPREQIAPSKPKQ